MCAFCRGPLTHGLMSHHRWQFRLMENESRRTMGEPADVFKRRTKETSFRVHQTPVKCTGHGMDPCEDCTFRCLHFEGCELAGRFHIADEEACRLAARGRKARFVGCRATRRPVSGSKKPETVQDAVTDSNCFVALKIRSRQRANPCKRISLGFRSAPSALPSPRGSAPGHFARRAQRPSKG